MNKYMNEYMNDLTDKTVGRLARPAGRKEKAGVKGGARAVQAIRFAAF